MSFQIIIYHAVALLCTAGNTREGITLLAKTLTATASKSKLLISLDHDSRLVTPLM